MVVHESKLRFLDSALLVFRRKGYSATTVDDVCAEAGLTKGSFFHHFTGKEELALEAADRFSSLAEELFAAAPYRGLTDPLDRVLGYVEFRRALLSDALPECTCLLGTLVQETYLSHPQIRAACERGIFGHAEELAADLALAKRLYAPQADWTAESVSRFMLSVIQGAFILAKAGGGAAVAGDCISHLGRYIGLLFGRSELREGSGS